MTTPDPAGTPTVLVVDVANVVGSVPDGWWRDRAGAAERLLGGLAPLRGRTIAAPDGDLIRLERILAVLEGRSNLARDPYAGPSEGLLEIARSPGSGDDEIADLATDLVAAGHRVLVVTADRGLRARLPAATAAAGPRWLNALLGRA